MMACPERVMEGQIANLEYDASTERLTGTIGHALPFNIPAYSGGSRGHQQVKTEISKLYLHSEASSPSSRYANTETVGKGTKASPYKQRGGTLPPGHYSCNYIAHHEHFHECIWLKRDADTHFRYPTASGVSLDNRADDFYIHGSGPKGSDGCIVIPDKKERLRLNHAVRDFSKHGHVILLVKNVAYLLPAERDDLAIA
jgi:hypothetical protein